MTAPHVIDPARFLSEQREQASPDLMRSMLTTFINALSSAEAYAVYGADYGTRSEVRSNSPNLLPGLAAGAPPPGRSSPDDRGRDLLPARGLHQADGEARRDPGHHPAIEVPGLGHGRRPRCPGRGVPQPAAGCRPVHVRGRRRPGPEGPRRRARGQRPCHGCHRRQRRRAPRSPGYPGSMAPCVIGGPIIPMPMSVSVARTVVPGSAGTLQAVVRTGRTALGALKRASASRDAAVSRSAAAAATRIVAVPLCLTRRGCDSGTERGMAVPVLKTKVETVGRPVLSGPWGPLQVSAGLRTLGQCPSVGGRVQRPCLMAWPRQKLCCERRRTT